VYKGGIYPGIPQGMEEAYTPGYTSRDGREGGIYTRVYFRVEKEGGIYTRVYLRVERRRETYTPGYTSGLG